MDTRIWLRVDDADPDEQHLEQLALMLRAELIGLGVTVDRPSAGSAPPGARAVEWAAIGALLVTLAGSPVLASLIDAVSAWLGDRRQRKVMLEIDGDRLALSGAPTEDERAAAQRWVRRHSGDSAPAGKRAALIVANSDYRDPGLSRLRAPARDAERLAGVLGDPRIGGFGVRTLLDQPAAVINEAVEDFFADRDPDDLLLVHFSGHGIKDESGELYFAASGTRLNRLGGTAVAADFVTRLMNRSRSRRIVLLLDCCYSGAFARGMVARAGSTLALDEQFGGTGRAVITASSAVQYAFEGQELADGRDPGPSVFTTALVEGLDSGDADRDQDGYVGLDELYEYVYDRVRRTTPNQTPGMWVLDLQGDLRIARRARPVTKPSELPEDLRHAMEHTVPSVRAGAVEELARLMAGRHEGLALAGRRGLEHLADDDSRMVSAKASAALGVVRKPAPKQPASSARAPSPMPDPAPPRPDSVPPPQQAPVSAPTPRQAPDSAPAPRQAPASAPPPWQGPASASAARQVPVSAPPPRQGPVSAPAPLPPRPVDYWQWASRSAAVCGLLMLVLGGGFTASRESEYQGALFDLLAVLALTGAAAVLAVGRRWRDQAQGVALGASASLLGMLVLINDDEPLWEYGNYLHFGSWATAYGVLLIIAAALLDGLAGGRRTYAGMAGAALGLLAVAVYLADEVPPLVILVTLFAAVVVLAGYRAVTQRRVAVVWSPAASCVLVLAAAMEQGEGPGLTMAAVLVAVTADFVLPGRQAAVAKVLAVVSLLAHSHVHLAPYEALDGLPYLALVAVAGLLACYAVNSEAPQAGERG